MFTPPPSPRPISKPSPTPSTHCDTVISSPSEKSTVQVDTKKLSGRRMRWAVLLVPTVMIFITASARYITHPAAFDLLVETPPSSWRDLLQKSSNWTPHKRHPQFSQAASSSSSSSSLSSSSAPPTSSQPSTTTNAIPTVPAAPPTLPTPFPQPYDGGIQQNFSSVACFNFFSNMTSSQPFRTCRAFSMLSSSSDEFLSSQRNISLANTLIWGTCNTKTDHNQCIENMASFSSQLQDICSGDLKDRNDMVINALTALNAYEVMYNASCIIDPTTNAYCYISAAQDSNPSDLYHYSLPLGISLPSSITPSCSSCTKSVLQTYAVALMDPEQKDKLSGLSETYEAAAELSDRQCNPSYAQIGIVNRAGALKAGKKAAMMMVGFVGLMFTLI